ncbi:MAG: ABC transporter substrate-binding protein [Bacteroidales bacterium]|jgi:iron complex transport system substrate-binding protein
MRLSIRTALRGPRFRGDDTVIVLAVVLALVLAGSCRVKEKRGDAGSQNTTMNDTTSLSVRYAKGFRFEKNADGLLLVMSDPNKVGNEIARYRLLPSKNGIKTLEVCTDIVVPIRGLAASSTTHAGFLSAIGASDKLMGCNNPERLYDTLLLQRYRKGELVRTGRDLGYNLEYLIASRPDLVLQSGIDGQFKPDTRLTGAGIPVMFVLEWMESTPLGRAEWIKVFGMITGRYKAADSLFRLVEKNYLNYAGKGHETPEKIKVLTGNVFKGTWYMPGGKNYMARFFEDAGMDYIYRDTDQSASLALSFESVILRLTDAKVWISVNVDSLSQLMAAEPRYSVFKALQDRRVYSVFNRVNDQGGNDFWEGAVVRPDRVLADLLSIAHPELGPGHNWNYFKPLVYN